MRDSNNNVIIGKTANQLGVKLANASLMNLISTFNELIVEYFR